MRGSASLIVGLLAGISATMQASHLPVRIYTTADGLAANTVNRIVRDSRGFLWFCTREGLSRFDGYQFTNFGTGQGLPVSDNFLLETRRGEYWVATDYGVAKFNPADSRALFTLYRPHDPKARKVNILAEDTNGDIWCGTTAGLYRLEQVKVDSHSGETAQWRLRFVDIGMPRETGEMVIEALLQDRSGALWIGGPGGIRRRSLDGRIDCYFVGKLSWGNHVTSLLQDPQERLWAGTWAGLWRLTAGSKAAEQLIRKIYTTKDGLAGDVVGSLLESSDGQLWIGTDNGLSKYDGEGAHKTFENFTAANGLSESNVFSLGEDRAGNLWAGSVGANKISQGGFLSYGMQDGLASNFINSIVEDLKGELCVLTKGPNKVYINRIFLNRFDGSRFHSVLPNVPSTIKNWGWGNHQFQDSTGEWWVPTGHGLFRFPALANPAELRYARPEVAYGPWNGLAGENVFRLFEDSRGDIWIATFSSSKNGLTRWERSTNTLHQFSAKDLPPTDLITSFAEDRAGCVWVGSIQGKVARYRGSRFEFFKLGDTFSSRSVRALHLDDAGRIWVASEGGLTRIDSPTDTTPRFTIYTTTQGLSSNNVQCIVQDRYGRIYAGTDSGVDCFYPRTPLCIKHYTTADGLVLGRGMTSFRDHQGMLWFGSEAGLSRLKPEPERPQVAPPIFITSFHVRGVPQPISPLGEIDLAGFRFAPEQNQIEIEFVGLEFGAGNSLRYQYQLTGAGADQSTPTDQRRINYAGLSPGSYHFLVRAVTSDGLFSARPATVAFTILAPVWQRPWFRILAVLLAAAFIFALYRYRVTRLLEMERLRTRIATDLHDDIGSTLSQIAILSEIASRNSPQGTQLQPFSEIAALSRASVDSMSDIVWAIDPEQDRLGDLSHRMRRFASDLFSGNGVCVHFRGPGEEQDQAIGADKRRQIFLIFKESLHNTARHSACTEVEIDLRLEKGWLALTVRDDGKGFDMLQVRKGHGLLSFDQRAKQLGGRVIVDSAPGCGTIVRLRIPLSDHLPGKRSYPNG